MPALTQQQLPHFRILLTEDNTSDSQLISKALNESDLATFEIVHTANLADALTAAAKTNFDAVILDLSLPDSDGILTLDTFLEKHPALTVIVLTGLENELLGINAVRKGAEEYLLKKEIMEGHLGRFVTLAIERRKRTSVPQTTKKMPLPLGKVAIGNVEVDLLRQTVFINNNESGKSAVALTPIEFRILTIMLTNPNQVLSRPRIVTEIWAEDEREISSRTVDKHISSLKRKCTPALDKIQSVYGVGYCFEFAQHAMGTESAIRHQSLPALQASPTDQ